MSKSPTPGGRPGAAASYASPSRRAAAPGRPAPGPAVRRRPPGPRPTPPRLPSRCPGADRIGSLAVGRNMAGAARARADTRGTPRTAAAVTACCPALARIPADTPSPCVTEDSPRDLRGPGRIQWQGPPSPVAGHTRAARVWGARHRPPAGHRTIRPAAGERFSTRRSGRIRSRRRPLRRRAPRHRTLPRMVPKRGCGPEPRCRKRRAPSEPHAVLRESLRSRLPRDAGRPRPLPHPVAPAAVASTPRGGGAWLPFRARALPLRMGRCGPPIRSLRPAVRVSSAPAALRGRAAPHRAEGLLLRPTRRRFPRQGRVDRKA